MARADIFEHCGDDEAEQRWEEQLDEYEGVARLIHGEKAVPPSDRQLYAMRVSWAETERHRKLRRKVKHQWDLQNPPQEDDDIMNAAKKAESPEIAAAGLPPGVAEAVVDPRLMPPPEMLEQWAEQGFDGPKNPEALHGDDAAQFGREQVQRARPQFISPAEELGEAERYISQGTSPLREGASIYDVDGAMEEHGLGRFKQGMKTPDVVRDRRVTHAEQHVLINREETVEEHLIRIGVTYKHRTSTKTGRVWLNVAADSLAKAEGRPYTKEKKK